MKIKNILMAGVVAITSISLPTLANAETSYATPQELLIEALEVAVSGVESTTYDEALDYVESLITVSGSAVSYDGDVIGYWDSTNSDTLFADSAFTNEVLSNGGTDIWEFNPDILSPMLTDFNNKLVETIVPTTEDWSKIIGKYDITLGDTTIPADQWIISDNYTYNYNFTKETGIHNYRGTNEHTDHACPAMFGWAVVDGELYLTSIIIELCGWISHLSNDDSLVRTHVVGAAQSYGTDIVDAAPGTYHWINLAIDASESITDMPLGYTLYKDMTLTGGLSYITNASEHCSLRNIKDVTDVSTIVLRDVDSYGLAYFMMPIHNYTFNNSSSDPLIDIHDAFWEKAPQSSKQQIGNTLLKQRLNKFSSLVEGDTIEVTPTTWTIKGLGGEESDFDTYLGSQDIMAPGEETSIPATADIEALAFKVVLPTSLPIYVNELNQVSVATNATVKNESGAAVIVNSVNIEAKPDTGWTLLTSGTPSKARDAKEFTFTTDLAADTVLAVAEERPFRYNAELSPSTEGVEQLDLAEVLVTIDWAEVT